MVYSMTGYGKYDTGSFKIECRSLNHRYLDIYIKSPPSLFLLEPAIKNLVKKQFSRGRIEILISKSQNFVGSFKINHQLALELYNTLKSLSEELSIPNNIGVDVFKYFKEVFYVEESEYEDSELLNGVNTALEELKEMRAEEGKSLETDVKERIGLLQKYIDEIEGKSNDYHSAIKEKYKKRIMELLGNEAVDENRILQEIAILSEKADITEEIVRTQSHLQHMMKVLETNEPSGRKMDFICQEINREINTIGSKSSDIELSTIIVQMKSELERLREQIQNVQ